MDSTSSEFYSDEDVDEEGWTSEPETGDDSKKKAKAVIRPRQKTAEELAAEAAARDKEMFAKLPTRSYTDLAKRTKSGLLSELFHPNPNRFPEGHPYRSSLSHQDIVAKGWNPGGPALYGARFPTSKSSAALPQMAAVTAESVTSKNGIVGPASVKATSGPTIATAASGPSIRPRGRPANVEEEDSDTDGEEDNPISKSLVQRKLETLVASNNKKSGSGSGNSPAATNGAHPRPSASSGMMAGVVNGARDRRQSAPEETVCVG